MGEAERTEKRVSSEGELMRRETLLLAKWRQSRIGEAIAR